MNNRDGQFLAFLVGGPANGNTVYLDNGTREYLFAQQDTLKALTQLKDHFTWGNFSIKHHRYELTSHMYAPFYKGCYIFQWMEEKR